MTTREQSPLDACLWRTSVQNEEADWFAHEVELTFAACERIALLVRRVQSHAHLHARRVLAALDCGDLHHSSQVTAAFEWFFQPALDDRHDLLDRRSVGRQAEHVG